MTIVYYYVVRDPYSGQDMIAVTDKDFFDKYGCMDDGSGDCYEGINLAMSMCGAFEEAESDYAVPSTGLDKLISDMRELGFELVQNNRFSAIFQEGM